jgi:MFS family permease
MNDVVQILGGCAIIPACIALAVIYLARRFLPADLFTRYAAAMSLAAAFFVGYVLLPSWAEVSPSRHWQWLPYLAIAAALHGPVGFANGIWVVERKLLWLLFAFAAAYLLVPNWESLQPPRATTILLLACYLFGLVVLTEPLSTRFTASRLLAVLSIVAIGNAMAITFAVSLKYGQLAGIAAAALSGAWVASKLVASALNIRALIPIAITLIGGTAFVGAIEPSPPLFDLLAIPATPLMLWFFTIKQMNQRQGTAIALFQVALVLVPIAAVAIRMLLAEREPSY